MPEGENGVEEDIQGLPRQPILHILAFLRNMKHLLKGVVLGAKDLQEVIEALF